MTSFSFCRWHFSGNYDLVLHQFDLIKFFSSLWNNWQNFKVKELYCWKVFKNALLINWVSFKCWHQQNWWDDLVKFFCMIWKLKKVRKTFNPTWSILESVNEFKESASSCISCGFQLATVFRLSSYTFFYKEHVYKELEAENGPKNKELLRNCSGWE